MRRSVGALLKAATKRQLGAAVFVLVCALMLLVDWTFGEPAANPAPASRPVTATASAQPDIRSAADRAADEKRAVPEGAQGTHSDVPSPAPIAAAPHRSPVDVLLSGPTFTRFVGFSMLSIGIAAGVLFFFWRQTREDQ